MEFRVEEAARFDSVDAAAQERLGFYAAANAASDDVVANGRSRAEDVIRQGTRDTLSRLQNEPADSPGRHGRQTVDVIDANRNASEPRSDHGEEPALGRAGVDDGRFQLPEHAIEPPHSHQVTQRRDCPQHRHGVNGDAFLRAKAHQVRSWRGDGLLLETERAEEPPLSAQEKQRDGNGHDVQEPERRHLSFPVVEGLDFS